MKTSIIAAITALSSLAAANPLSKRFNVSVTFYGENGESYGMLFPTDTSSVEISKYISSVFGHSSHLRSKPDGSLPHHLAWGRILYLRWRRGRDCRHLRRGRQDSGDSSGYEVGEL